MVFSADNHVLVKLLRRKGMVLKSFAEFSSKSKIDFASVVDGKEDKFLGLGAGRCQQKFTGKCKKLEVDILQSYHERQRQIS